MKENPARPMVGDYLIALLASVLQGEIPPPMPAGLPMEKLYQFAAWQSVANMAYYGLSKLEPLPPEPIMESFKQARSKALAKEARQELEVRQILAAFEEQQIKHMPLKGFIIKHLYPQPDMRLMADVDILVKTDKLKAARDIMLNLGYTAVHEGGNHDVYHKLPVMNIELHRALIAESHHDLYAYFGTGWQRAVLQAGKNYSYEMSREDFYIYLLAHMAKHYRGGGTGIRSVMDVWVYKKHYQDSLDWDYTRSELAKAGLADFAENMEGLSECWFDGREINEHYQEMTAFVLSNGTYGTAQNAALSRFIKTRNASDSFRVARLKYTLRIFFPNREHMTILFPFLQKLPFLLPLCWVVRGLRTVLLRPANIKHRILDTVSLTETKSTQREKIQRQSGFK